MADSGAEQGVAVAASGGEGEPVVKSAKQLKKDAKKKEKFQRKQAKMAGQQKQNNNSGSEARESVFVCSSSCKWLSFLLSEIPGPIG